MKKEIMITLPARQGVPQVELYCQYYSNSSKLGTRDVLLAIPGGPGNDHAIYDPPDHSMAKAFFPYADILLFDPRNCGKSEITKPEYSSLDHYMDDIEAIREYFQIPPDKLIILGQSYGSIAALGYATKYPNSLKKLILIGGAASSEFLEEAKRNLNKIGTLKQQELGKKLWNGTFTGEPNENDEFFQTMTPLYQLSFKPGMPTPPLTYNVDVFNFGFGDFLKKFDFRPGLKNIKCKTLILWGADDWICDKNQGKIIHEGIKGSVLKMYSHCSHLIWLDQWENFLADVTEFLNS
jgi:proline iminopeptidase